MKGHIGNGVHLRVQRNQMVVSCNERERVPDEEADQWACRSAAASSEKGARVFRRTGTKEPKIKKARASKNALRAGHKGETPVLCLSAKPKNKKPPAPRTRRVRGINPKGVNLPCGLVSVT